MSSWGLCRKRVAILMPGSLAKLSKRELMRRRGNQGKTSRAMSGTEVKPPSMIRPAAGARDASSTAAPAPSDSP
ncbi:MAG: hypothetical protein A2X37_00685 [Elusimicrobia bacterium GWA2_66_18]|nr:MAG: hypothetical protein A2X37_00685 [Elusimicrobia bacterium GWA2_66_18]